MHKGRLEAFSDGVIAIIIFSFIYFRTIDFVLGSAGRFWGLYGGCAYLVTT